MKNKNHLDASKRYSCFPKPLRFCKRGDIVYQTITHLILITLIFAIFFLAATSKVTSKVVKQQVLEKQTALLIDAADKGMTFIIDKTYLEGGTIGNIELKQGRVFVYIAGQGFSKGYPYFSRYDVSLVKEEDRYLIKIG